MATHSLGELKEAVRNFWNADPCGTRYLESEQALEAHARERYRLEPYMHDFAFTFRVGKE